jgi:hypothetical protein
VLVVGQYFVPSDPVEVKDQAKTVLFHGAFAVLIAVAVFAVARARHSRDDGESGARVWFYDQSAARLYAVPRDLIPPDGASDTRVRAMVVRFQDMGKKIGELKVAYLEKYSPEFKALLERAQAAHAARLPFMEKLPSQNSEYYQDNTFVKRPAESSWHTLGSAEAREIMQEWRTWRGPAGQPPIISVPPFN